MHVNREGLDFDTAQALSPVQTFELARSNDVQDIPVKRALFGNVYNISLFFESNYEADTSEIFYLGFKGDFTRLSREPVEVLYEAAANPQDHAPIVGINAMAGQNNRSGR